MKILTTVFLALAVLLSACDGPPPIIAGAIIEKEHQPQRFWIQYIFIPQKIGNTTTTRMIPILYFDDEDWIIRIENYVGKQYKRATFYIEEAEYKSVNIGDWYVDPDAVTIDRDIKRRATKEEEEKYKG